MTTRNMRTTLSALIGAGFITVSASSALAGNCNWMEGKSALNHSNAARFHHAVYYSAGDMNRGAFKKAAHHGSKASMDIVDTAASAGSFNTLVTAIKAAGLVDTLKGKGPFTVFAPTDEAFAKIPKDDLNALLKDKKALTRVLTYHVVPGKVKASDVVKLESVDTVEGQSIAIDASSGVKVNNAKVIKTDIMTGNGVIHVIDTVLIPKS